MVDINQLRPLNVNLVNNKGSKMKEERQPLLNNASTDSPGSESVVAIGDRRSDALIEDPPDLLIVPPGNKEASSASLASAPSGHFDPILNRQLDHPTSNLDTMIHLLKGNIGTGILAMPDAFLNAGLVVGTIGTLLMGAICTHCMHMLVNCSHELCRRSQVPSLNFSQVIEHAFMTGPHSLRSYRKSVKLLVNIFLVITQLGFCCVYFVFVATNLQQLVEHYFERIPLHWFLLALLLPMILLNWVNNLKYLTPVSLLAAILTTTGLGITFFYILQGLPKTSTVRAFAPLNRLPLFFGTAIYAFEGIGVVLPLENNMANPEDFGGMTGVLNTGMVIVACLYTAVGFFGYLRYGDHMKQGSITLNLPQNELLAQSVRLMMALAIFLSYGLQFYVPMGIIWPPISERFTTESSRKAAELVTRTILVIITFSLAAAIPNLGAVISLVGAVSSSALALIFPPIIEVITFWNKDITYRTILKDVAITLFGIAGFLFGTYASVRNILSPYHTS